MKENNPSARRLDWSVTDVAIREVRRLRRRSYRQAVGRTIAEGYPEVRRAVTAGVPIDVLYICPDIFVDRNGEFRCLPVVEVSREVFKEMAFGRRLKGILAVCSPAQLRLDDITLGDPPRLVILEGLEKPGNIGTIIRAADGAGLDAVVMCRCRTDPYNHNIVRASLGTVFHQPVVEAAAPDILAFCRGKGVPLFASSSSAERLYTQVDFRHGFAIIIGSEHDGVSAFWRSCADHGIRIPMRGAAGSLNAAMSASILMYEALRQIAGN